MTPICLDSLDLRYHLVSQCADKLNPRISEHWEQNTVPPTTFPTFPQMRDSRQVLRHFRGFQRLRNLRVRSVAQDSKVRILSSDGSHGCTSPGHLQAVIICKSVGKKTTHFFQPFYTWGGWYQRTTLGGAVWWLVKRVSCLGGFLAGMAAASRWTFPWKAEVLDGKVEMEVNWRLTKSVQFLCLRWIKCPPRFFLPPKMIALSFSLSLSLSFSLFSFSLSLIFSHWTSYIHIFDGCESLWFCYIMVSIPHPRMLFPFFLGARSGITVEFQGELVGCGAAAELCNFDRRGGGEKCLLGIYLCVYIYMCFFQSLRFFEGNDLCIYIYTYGHIYTYVHIYIYTYVHIYIYTNIHVCIYTCVHIYIHLHIFTYIYIYLHNIFTHIYIYLHIFT